MPLLTTHLPLALVRRFGDAPLHHAIMAHELKSVELLLE